VKRLLIPVALLVLFCASGAAAQDKASKSFGITVSHSVNLSWTASTSSDVDSYNVYRGTVNGGPYTKIASTAYLTYQDLDVASGVTYYYVATAVDTSGLESVYSNQASAVIPTP
jgi:fibronectin type 3 domain-containing protein